MFSSALPIQKNDGGSTHFKCQPVDYWIEKLENHGLNYRDDLTIESKLFSTMKIKGKFGKSFWDMSGLIFIKNNDKNNNNSSDS